MGETASVTNRAITTTTTATTSITYEMNPINESTKNKTKRRREHNHMRPKIREPWYTNPRNRDLRRSTKSTKQRNKNKSTKAKQTRKMRSGLIATYKKWSGQGYGPRPWRLHTGSPHPCAAQRGPSNRAIHQQPQNTNIHIQHYGIFHKLIKNIDKITTLRRKGMLGKLRRRIKDTKHNQTQQRKGDRKLTKQEWQREKIRIAHINIRGINSTYKRHMVENGPKEKQSK